MNRSTLYRLGLIGLILLMAVTASAQRFDRLVSRSIFADKRAFYEGDIVTILIVEFTEGQNETGTMTNSDNQMRTGVQSSGLKKNINNHFDMKKPPQRHRQYEDTRLVVGKNVRDNC